MNEPVIRNSAEFQHYFNVSRETLERLEIYVEALSLWQKKINLVAGSTLDDVWSRHIADSAQLFLIVREEYERMDKTDSCFDLGSGAGFPGLVMGILAAENDAVKRGLPPMQLVERSAKKCAFMRDVIRKTGGHAKVINKRIESCLQISNSINTRLITARALTSLDQLLNFSQPVWRDGTKAYFLKGGRFRSEIDEAQMKWEFAFSMISSLTNQDSVILEISDLRRKEIED